MPKTETFVQGWDANGSMHSITLLTFHMNHELVFVPNDEHLKNDTITSVNHIQPNLFRRNVILL